MRKDEFLSIISDRTGLPKTDINAVLEVTGEVTQFALTKGNDVSLPHIGKLSAATRSARKGHNPQTGEAIDIPEKQVVKFKATKSLIQSLNA